MFFDDEPLEKRKSYVLKALPPTPNTGWLPPREFPNLSTAKLLGIDTETKELDFEHGPGWGRGKGHIVGMSVAADDGYGRTSKWYFPMRHEVEPEYNIDPTRVLMWARDALGTQTPKVGANITYDVGWLADEGVTVAGELHDVQFAETLLTFNGHVNLDWLGTKYLNEGKAGNDMYRWQAEAYGGSANDKQRANIYRTSPRLVGPYGESDADLPIRILRHQWPLLDAKSLLWVYQLEIDLIPLMVEMRRQGVRVNVAAAEELYAKFGLDVERLERLLSLQVGFPINVDSGADIAKAFDAYGLSYPRTAHGTPSFTKDFLKVLDHEIGEQILELRMLKKLRSTFLKSYILERHQNGIVHATFNQLRGDDGGASSGRFSSNDPNLQNVSSRPGVTETKLTNKKSPHYDATYIPVGKRIRSLIIPDDGHVEWEKDDFSQIQYRYLAHFAVGAGSDELRRRYCEDPKTDYHNVVQSMVETVAGMFIERDPLKNINFGLVFGMGKSKLARQIGVSGTAATNTFNAYHTGAPYVKATMDHYAQAVLDTGEVRTIGGRIAQFNLWEPIRQSNGNRQIALSYDAAISAYGSRIQRAYSHKGLNFELQGSEGDHMKAAMRKCYKDGVFHVIGVPRLTVHDELGYSVISKSKEQNDAYAYMRRTMETVMPLRVPVFVDCKRGPNWGETK